MWGFWTHVLHSRFDDRYKNSAVPLLLLTYWLISGNERRGYGLIRSRQEEEDADNFCTRPSNSQKLLLIMLQLEGHLGALIICIRGDEELEIDARVYLYSSSLLRTMIYVLQTETYHQASPRRQEAGSMQETLRVGEEEL